MIPEDTPPTTPESFNDTSTAAAATTPTTILQNTQGSRMLQVPEILERIFEFLSQFHLVSSVIRVCRFWNIISQRVIETTTYWHESQLGVSPLSFNFLARLGRSKTFHCIYGLSSHGSASTERTRRWLKEGLWEHQDQNQLKQILQQRPPSASQPLQLLPQQTSLHAVSQQGMKSGWVLGAQSTIRTLILERAFDEATFDILDFAALGASLTRLDIRAMDIHTFAMETVLESFCNLRELAVSFLKPAYTNGCQLFKVDGKYATAAREEEERVAAAGANTDPESGINGATMSIRGEGAPEAAGVGKRTRLRSLFIERATVDMKALRQLLKASPDLEELKLLTIGRLRPLGLNGQQNASHPSVLKPFESEVFFTELGQMCPKIRSLAFFERNGLPALPLVWDMFQAITPTANSAPASIASSSAADGRSRDTRGRVQNWTTVIQLFFVASPEMKLGGSLQPYVDRLTTLEIVSKWGEVSMSDLCLHQYLCQAPQLLHLLAPSLMFDAMRWVSVALEEPPSKEIQTLVQAHRRQYGHTPSPSSVDPELARPTTARSGSETTDWACKGLQTLHISFLGYHLSGHSLDQGGDEGDSVPRQPVGRGISGLDKNCRGYEGSKRIFSYLARVLPQLKDLMIRYSDVRLELEAGLCLLSKLQGLESLVIFTESPYRLKDRDLAWMANDAGVRKLALTPPPPVVPASARGGSSWAGIGDWLWEKASGAGGGGSGGRQQQQPATLFDLLSTLIQAQGTKCWPGLERLWIRSLDDAQFGRSLSSTLQWEHPYRTLVCALRPELVYMRPPATLWSKAR